MGHGLRAEDALDALRRLICHRFLLQSIVSRPPRAAVMALCLALAQAPNPHSHATIRVYQVLLPDNAPYALVDVLAQALTHISRQRVSPSSLQLPVVPPRRRHSVPGAHNSPNGHRFGSTVGPLRARGAGDNQNTPGAAA
jgi:hypothetical protein